VAFSVGIHCNITMCASLRLHTHACWKNSSVDYSVRTKMFHVITCRNEGNVELERGDTIKLRSFNYACACQWVTRSICERGLIRQPFIVRTRMPSLLMTAERLSVGAKHSMTAATVDGRPICFESPP